MMFKCRALRWDGATARIREEEPGRIPILGLSAFAF